jgi:hypothetical protein
MTGTEATTSKCRRCGRKLTASVGIGPVCARKEIVEAAYSERQVTDALEQVELGGVIPLRGRRVFLTVGSHGETYRTAATGQCNCAAGLAGRRCYHGAAARLVAFRPPAVRYDLAA